MPPTDSGIARLLLPTDVLRLITLLSRFMHIKLIFTIGVLVLLLGCAHDPPSHSLTRLAGPATEADANAIAQAAASSTNERWKRVDSVARKLDSAWSVFVCPIPARVAGPYVLVTVDASGQVMRLGR